MSLAVLLGRLAARPSVRPSVRRYPCRRISSLPPRFLFPFHCPYVLYFTPLLEFFASLIFLGARDVTKASARSFRARLYPRTALRALGRSGVRRERDLPLRLKKRTQKGAYDTGYSQAVTHPSTNPAQPGLTSVIGREPVYSRWYGRRRESSAEI